MGKQKQSSAAQVAGMLLAMLGLVWACGTATGASKPDEPAAAPSPAAAAPTPPPFSPKGTVAKVVTPANIVLTDGRRIHVAAMNSVLPWKGQYTDTCERDADLELARKMLAGKPVKLVAPPRSEDVEELVPAEHVQADVQVGGRDYARTFTDRAYDAHEKCRPKYTVPETSSGSGSSGTYSGDVDVDVSRGGSGMRDGALTGGFCARHRWC